MKSTLRAFVAVPIPDSVTVFIRQVQARLQSSGMNIRWVAANKIHLTLKFLGQIDPSRVPGVATTMDAVAGSIPPFLLGAGGPGMFPNHRRARVLWVGLDGNIERLMAIQAALESGLGPVGFREETRPFHPHLTIGRSRRRLDAETLGASLESMKDVASDSFRVERLVLYKSMLSPAGAEYARLHTSYLTI